MTPPETIICDLWFPPGSPLSRVRICDVSGAEWAALASWAIATGTGFPEQFPLILDSGEREHFQRIVDALDWSAMPSDALGCVATLTEFLRQAEMQNAGAAIGPG